MKTISAGLTTHIGQTVTSLAMLLKITRVDGTDFFFAGHDQDIVFSGDTYLSTVMDSAVAVPGTSTLAVDNLDIMFIIDGTTLIESEIRGGLFDFAEFRLSLVNWDDLSQNDLKLKRGWIGEVIETTQGVFRAEFRSMTDILRQVTHEVYQPECRYDLGDSRCTVPIYPPVIQRNTAYTVPTNGATATFLRVATTGGSGQEQYENRVYEVTTGGTTAATQPAYNTTLGSTTTDGTAVLTARDAFMRNFTVATVTDALTFTITVIETRSVDDWFNGGGLTFESGNNNGLTFEIKDWVDSTSEVTLFLPAPFTIQVGDTGRMYRGCDFSLATCINPFDNVINFGGEPFLPGREELFKIGRPSIAKSI